MGHCIIHVGMYKTGTTSIQRSLHRFADERFVYAYLGHPNHTPAIYAALDFRANALRSPVRLSRSEAIARIRQSMIDARDRTCLISGEGIVRLPPGKLKVLRGLLLDTCDGITIAAAIREPFGFMASAFQTRVRRFTGKDELNPFKYRDYRSMFAKFDEVFGRENVRLWKFDPASYPDGCAVRDFCARFDIRLPDSRIERHNDSLSREALGLLYIYRKLGQRLGSTVMTGTENQLLSEGLMRIGTTRFRFSPDVIKPVLEKHRADIDWMENRIGQSLRVDLGKHRPGDVRDESDLLTPDPRAVEELITLLGNLAPRRNKGRTPKEVARIVHALRLKAAGPPVHSPLKVRALEILDRAAAPFRKWMAHP